MYPYLDFLSGNRNIKYPFSEKAILPRTIPRSFLIDLVIATKTDEPYFLRRISNKISTIDIIISNQSESIMLNFTIDCSNNNKLYTKEEEDVSIKLLIGDANSIKLQGIHSYFFNETIFEECCVIPYPAIVEGIEVNNVVYNGNIKFIAGYNIDIKENDGQIEFSSFPGAGFGRYINDDKKEYTHIRSINNNKIKGNFNIDSSECINIIKYKTSNTVAINNNCTPCCINCAEDIDTINDKTVTVQIDIDSLDQRISNLGG